MLGMRRHCRHRVASARQGVDIAHAPFFFRVKIKLAMAYDVEPNWASSSRLARDKSSDDETSLNL